MVDAIGVTPAGAGARHARLFGALEREWPVRFVEAQPGDTRGLIARIDVGLPREEPPSKLPTLALSAADGYPKPRAADVTLHRVPTLARPLQGHVVREDGLRPRPLAAFDDADVVMASAEGMPAWTWSISGGGTWVASAALPDLGDDRMLRDCVREGEFLGATALIHFLRSVMGDRAWALPAPRASFLFDDPNLHATTYGYIRYPEIVADGDEHGYHAAMATVPADGWYVNRRASRLFRERSDRLSLLIHGNDHVSHELGRDMTDAARDALVRQSLRRIQGIERRAGISISRVVAPPHGALSQAMMQTMRGSAIEAACISRAFPWMDDPPADRPLTGSNPGDIVGGFPVIPRHRLEHPRIDLAFRLFLGQPAILYGHHDDVEPGIGVLSQAADDVARCGGAEWMSLGDIAARHFATQTHGPQQLIRPFSRRIKVDVPDGVHTLRLTTANDDWYGDEIAMWRTAMGVAVTPLDGEVQVAPGERVELYITTAGEEQGMRRGRAGLSAWGRTRRVLTESRDRLAPVRRAARERVAAVR